MKRTLFLSVLFGMLLVTAHAENESHQQVDSTLYAYYRWCNNNIRDTAVLSKADTLFRLSGEKHDIRMQAVAEDGRVAYVVVAPGVIGVKRTLYLLVAFVFSMGRGEEHTEQHRQE